MAFTVSKLLLMTFVTLVMNASQTQASDRSSVPDLQLMTKQEYANLSPSKKINYVNNVRMTWMEFEKRHPQAQELAQKQNSWDALVTSMSAGMSFLDQAHAADAAPPCIICGVKLVSVKNAEGRYVCPTRGRPCNADGETDGFQCGPLFDNVCIPRNPISTLSYRGYMKKSAEALTPEEYAKAKADIESTYRQICFTNKGPGCSILAIRLNELKLDPIQIAEIKLAPQVEMTSPAPQPQQGSTRAVVVESSLASSTVEAVSPPSARGSIVVVSRQAAPPTPQSAASVRVATSAAPARTVVSTPKSNSSPAALVPMFSFDQSQRHHFENNKNTLAELERRNCNTGVDTSRLFTTTLKIKDRTRRSDGTEGPYPFIMNHSSLVNGIVEEIQNVTEGEDSGYRLKMLLPSMRNEVGSLSRVYLTVIQRGGKYYLKRSDGSISEEIVINNNPRDTVFNLSQGVTTTREALERQVISNATMADDCKLAAQVRAFAPTQHQAGANQAHDER